MLRALKKNLESARITLTNYIKNLSQILSMQGAEAAEKSKTERTTTAVNAAENSSKVSLYQIPKGKQNRYGTYRFDIPDNLWTYKASVRQTGDDKYTVRIDVQSHFELINFIKSNGQPMVDNYCIEETGVPKKYIQYVANTLVKALMENDFNRVQKCDKKHSCYNSYYYIYPSVLALGKE